MQLHWSKKKHHKKHRKKHAALTQGEQAGKSSSCAGCPNQSLCASGEAKKKDPALADVQDRLSKVKRKILVLSGGLGWLGLGVRPPWRESMDWWVWGMFSKISKKVNWWCWIFHVTYGPNAAKWQWFNLPAQWLQLRRTSLNKILLCWDFVYVEDAHSHPMLSLSWPSCCCCAGKGGVGKSTVSAQLSFGFSARSMDVGLLDVDICGPSVPRMLGLLGQDVHQSSESWSMGAGDFRWTVGFTLNKWNMDPPQIEEYGSLLIRFVIVCVRSQAWKWCHSRFLT